MTLSDYVTSSLSLTPASCWLASLTRALLHSKYPFKMYSLTRLQLYGLLKEKSKWNQKYEHAFSHVQLALGLESASIKVRENILKNVIRVCTKIKERLDRAGRSEKCFLQNNQEWLNGSVTFSSANRDEEEQQNEEQDLSTTVVEQSGSTSYGRPSKDFTESSERSKRRKTEGLRKDFTTPELTFATKSKLRSSGKIEESKLVEEALNTTPSRAKKISSAWKNSKFQTIKPYTPEEALALIIDTNLSKSDYQKIRNGAKEKGADIYPPYKKVANVKKLCYPLESSIIVTESVCKVELQPLLDHTARRITQYGEEVVNALSENLRTELVLISKWGCDGSSSQSTYKQKSITNDFRDSNLLMTCLVPLQLYVLQQNNSDDKLIVWQNPRSSSTRYCRPIKLEYVNETPEVVVKENEMMLNQINKLIPSEFEIESPGEKYSVTIRHELCMTMIDGKVCNILTDTTSSQTCNLCGATPVQMNHIDLVTKRPINKEALQFGLSTLHAYIRFLEWLLHVAYRLDIKKWRVKKEDIATRKLAIQEKFKREMGLLVDVVKPGEGTTNDGNTARRFFVHPHESAKITGVCEELIMRCDIVLRTMSCGYEVDVEAFRKYTMETAELYVSKYSWYYMPASVHKILMHGAEVIKSCPLPIGLMSEEAQEGRNKDFRYYRRSRARKCSRVATNEDVLHRMLVSSDPVISSLRKLPRKFSGSLSDGVVRLLKDPNLDGSINEESEGSNSDTDPY